MIDNQPLALQIAWLALMAFFVLYMAFTMWRTKSSLTDLKDPEYQTNQNNWREREIMAAEKLADAVTKLAERHERS